MPLPKSKKSKEQDYLKKLYLIYGDPKIGKSTIAANFAKDPDKVLFFPTEAGHKELEIYQWTTDKGEAPTRWEHFRDCVRELATEENDFKTLIVDTVDNLYMWCAKYICNKNEIEHESDLGFGKGYSAIKNEMLTVLNFLTQKGMGVIFISHKQESEILQNHKKITYTSPTLPNTGKKVITGLCDYIFYFYADFDENRYIQTKGSESIQAGDRSGKLPNKIEMNSELLIKHLKGEG